MISTWPKYIFIDDSSIQETRITNMRSSDDFEVGPKRVSANSCRTMYQIRFNMSVCLDDYTEYLRWYEEVIKQGTQWFLMKCPLRGTEFRFRFLPQDLQFRKEGNSMRKSCTLERWGNG